MTSPTARASALLVARRVAAARQIHTRSGEAARQASTFAELGICAELVEACDAMEWKEPTRIQAEAIPHALQGKDLIALAQTGSGKMGAFALPILQELLSNRQAEQSFFACVLSPTRELAIQIAEQFEALGSAFGLHCSVGLQLLLVVNQEEEGMLTE